MPFIPEFGQLFEETFRILQTPAQGRRRGSIILLPELWGIVPQVMATAGRFAAEGFGVFVPDILPGTLEPTSDPEKVRARYAPADDVLAMKKIAFIADRLRNDPHHRGPILVAGFCYGGRMALHAAAHVKIDGMISFYGTFRMPSGKRALDPWESAHNAAVPIQAHYGADDPTIPLAEVSEAKRLLRRGQVFIYEGAGHAFMNETRDSYRPRQARLAWGRVLDFLLQAERVWGAAHPLLPHAWEESGL
jgi:carboxymethylenebutenolidase